MYFCAQRLYKIDILVLRDGLTGTSMYRNIVRVGPEPIFVAALPVQGHETPALASIEPIRTGIHERGAVY